jgi:hypothetical protein
VRGIRCLRTDADADGQDGGADDGENCSDERVTHE